MPLVEWNDSYSVQNPTLDQQHRQLFELLNTLHDAMSQGKGKAILPEVFENLIQYTHTHFAFEEALMEQCDYPDLAAHQRKHVKLIEQIIALQQRFANGDFGSSIQTRDFLKSWLTDHIKSSDQKYGPFLIQKGIR